MKLTGQIPEAIARRRREGGDILFSPRSRTKRSPTVTVIDKPISITAYGLQPTERINVNVVSQGNEALFTYKAAPLTITQQRNTILLSITGTYVLEFEGDLGLLTVNATEVNSLKASGSSKYGPQPAGAAATRPNLVLRAGTAVSPIIDVISTPITLFLFNGEASLHQVFNDNEVPAKESGQDVVISDSAYILDKTGRYRLRSTGTTIAYAIPNLVDTFDPYPDYIPGPAGPPGPKGESGDGALLTVIAGETIHANRAVRVDNGLAYSVDTNIVDHGLAVVGVSRNAALVGGEVEIQAAGIMSNSGWAWDNAPVFASDTGILTQAPAATGWLLEVGIAINSTTLLIDLEPIIVRQ